jgi:hypothetical protein
VLVIPELTDKVWPGVKVVMTITSIVLEGFEPRSADRSARTSVVRSRQ